MGFHKVIDGPSIFVYGGIGQEPTPNLQTSISTLEWAATLLRETRSRHATSAVLDRVTALVAPEVSAVARFLEDRDRDTRADGNRDHRPVQQTHADRADIGEPRDVFEEDVRRAGHEGELLPSVEECGCTGHGASPSLDGGAHSVGVEDAAGASVREVPAGDPESDECVYCGTRAPERVLLSRDHLIGDLFVVRGRWSLMSREAALAAGLLDDVYDILCELEKAVEPRKRVA